MLTVKNGTPSTGNDILRVTTQDLTGLDGALSPNPGIVPASPISRLRPDTGTPNTAFQLNPFSQSLDGTPNTPKGPLLSERSIVISPKITFENIQRELKDLSEEVTNQARSLVSVSRELHALSWSNEENASPEKILSAIEQAQERTDTLRRLHSQVQALKGRTNIALEATLPIAELSDEQSVSSFGLPVVAMVDMTNTIYELGPQIEALDRAIDTAECRETEMNERLNIVVDMFSGFSDDTCTTKLESETDKYRELDRIAAALHPKVMDLNRVQKCVFGKVVDWEKTFEFGTVGAVRNEMVCANRDVNELDGQVTKLAGQMKAALKEVLALDVSSDNPQYEARMNLKTRMTKALGNIDKLIRTIDVAKKNELRISSKWKDLMDLPISRLGQLVTDAKQIQSKLSGMSQPMDETSKQVLALAGAKMQKLDSVRIEQVLGQMQSNNRALGDLEVQVRGLVQQALVLHELLKGPRTGNSEPPQSEREREADLRERLAQLNNDLNGAIAKNSTTFRTWLDAMVKRLHE